jgi:pilus biogenesis lipoprotein CpaD
MKNFAKFAGELLVLGALAACSATEDMHGNDPRSYYAEHPIKNTIETKNVSFKVAFAAGESKLSPGEIDKLSDNLHKVSILAVELIEINFANIDKKNDARKKHLERMLRNMGYVKGDYTYGTLPELKAGQVDLKLTYAVVVSPDCPDWRLSPVTTHSNTTQGNFACATEFNLGRMVADPHDLVHGTDGDIPIDTVSAAKAVQDYREGKSASGGSGGSSLTGSNSSEGSSEGGSATGLTQ